MNPSTQQADRTKPPAPSWLVVAAGLVAMIALGLSGYLTLQSMTQASAAGCGGDSGCAEVLASPWSKVGPVPVSLLGALVYLGVLFGLGTRIRPGRAGKRSDALLWLCVSAIVSAAAWFIYLQRVELNAFCAYCMTGHALGVVLAMILIAMLSGRSHAKPVFPLLLGVLATAGLATAQTLAPATGTVNSTANPFVDRDGDTVIDGQRHISLFGGDLSFILDDQPYLGRPDAQQVVAMIFDPACPHCRATHRLLTDAIDAGVSFALVPLPVSLAPEHNPYLDDPSPRFDDSYALATLSHAVAAVSRDDWPAFARWLVADDQPPTLDAAHEYARSLIDQDALDAQLVGGALAGHQAEIDRHTALLAGIPVADRRVPITTAPGVRRHRTERLSTPADLDALLAEAAEGLVVTDP